MVRRRDRIDVPEPDEERDEPEPTARPSDREGRELAEEEEERVVPLENVGGAVPTPLGLDSGGDLPGPDDDLASLPEPEPPEPPELDAVHVRDDERSRRGR